MKECQAVLRSERKVLKSWLGLEWKSMGCCRGLEKGEAPIPVNQQIVVEEPSVSECYNHSMDSYIMQS